MCCARTTSVNETQSARFACNLRWPDVTYSTCETVWCSHLRVPLSLFRNLDNSFNLKVQLSKTSICKRRVTQGYTGTECTSYHVLHTLEDSCLSTTLLQKTRPDTFLLRFHFIFTCNEHFPCRTWQGTVAHIVTVFGTNKSVWQTDWTTQLAHPTVKCTKQLQDMHVTRTVTAQCGPVCACHQHMTDSSPCLICVSSLAFWERKPNFGFLLSSLFRVDVYNRFFD